MLQVLITVQQVLQRRFVILNATVENVLNTQYFNFINQQGSIKMKFLTNKNAKILKYVLKYKINKF